VNLPKNLKVERVAPEQLPADWRDLDAREALQIIGSEWARRRSSAVLAVPSAVIPAETNYLLNPLHPAFARIEIGEPQVFVTDLRLRNR
jgi:RES domain-containing protein